MDLQPLRVFPALGYFLTWLLAWGHRKQDFGTWASLLVPSVSISGLLSIFVVRNLSPVPSSLLLAAPATLPRQQKEIIFDLSSSLQISRSLWCLEVVVGGTLRVALGRGGRRSGSGQKEIIVPRRVVARSVSPSIYLPSKSG